MQHKDMTEGNIWRQLLLFCIPILLGNLLQQLYNAFDAIVVGNYVGKEALAAVGSTGPLINMIISFFIGMSTGASVLISQFFGARDSKSLHDTVHTGMALSVIMGIALSLVGIFISPSLLRWMQTPPEVFDGASEYLRIYFIGLLFLTIYNMGTAILRAMGDAKRPLYFLMVSAVLNIVLNLLFVNVFHMGIAGVAWSTVIAEAVSAVLVIVVLCRSRDEHRLVFRDIRIHPEINRQIIKIGLPGGIQSAIISGSNIIVQSYINRLGGAVVAGYSASQKLDQFITLPVQTMAMAVTTFVAQNLGAGKVKRARRGARYSLILGVCITVLLSIVVLALRTTLLRIFTPDEQVLEYGFQFMLVFAPMYFLLAFTQIIPGALRGAGDVRMATVTCVVSFVGIRQIYLFFITKVAHTITTVAIGYPLTWGIAAIVLILYYRKTDWSRFARGNEAKE